MFNMQPLGYGFCYNNFNCNDEHLHNNRHSTESTLISGFSLYQYIKMDTDDKSS